MGWGTSHGERRLVRAQHRRLGSGALPSGLVKSPVANTVLSAQGVDRGSTLLLGADEYVARARPWPGEPGTVQLVTVEQSAPPREVIARWVDELREVGVKRIRTGALGPTVRPPYLETGFTVRQELSLLNHGLNGVRASVVPCESLLLQRGRRADLVGLSRVDGRGFGALWAMDSEGIVDACNATPHHRLRVAFDGTDIVGFAVSGRAGRSAYLQRLAVDPVHQGKGIGRALTQDALRWARRHRCSGMLVNTHVENETALGLYRSLGFEELTYRLTVLERNLR